MSSLVSYFSVFKNLPQNIKLKLFHVCDNQVAYCVSQKDEVFGLGENIHKVLAYEESNKENCVCVKELCGKQIEEFFEGKNFMFALAKTKQVFSWGQSENCQTAICFTGKNHKPTNVKEFDGKNVIQISCGFSHGVALTEDGMVLGWGDNRDKQIIQDKESKTFYGSPHEMRKITGNLVKSIHCMNNYSFALTIDGKVYLYNHNKYIEWGGSEGVTIDLAFELTFTTELTPILLKSKFCLLDPQNREFNLNEYFIQRYQKTHKTISFNEKDQMFSFDLGLDWNKLATKRPKLICIDDSKNVSVSNDLGQLKMSNVKCFYKSLMSEFIVIDDQDTNSDNVYTIGQRHNWVELISIYGKMLKLRDMNIISELCNKGIEEFYESKFCYFARSESFEIYSWAKNIEDSVRQTCPQQNINCQLGREVSENELYTPAKIDSFIGKKIILISCGSQHCLALSSDGIIYGWGDNSHGQLEGEDKFIFLPKKLNIISSEKHTKFKYIGCYDMTSFAVDIKGCGYYFGKKYYFGNSDDQLIPKKVIVEGIKKIMFNIYDHFIILKENGSVVVYNHGEDKSKPIKVKDENNIPLLITDIIHEPDNTSLLMQSNRFVHRYNYIHDKIERANYSNFYDYFTDKYNLTHKTIQIYKNSDRNGIVLKKMATKEIKILDKIIILEYKNIFDNKFDNNFKKIKELGRGNFGVVHHVKCLSSGHEFAIKRVELQDDWTYNLSEIEIMKKMDSNHVVKYYESWIEETKKIYAYEDDKIILNIKMELCAASLREVIASINKFNDVNLKIFRFYIACLLYRELIKGVRYLHTLVPSIIHRDLKPENVMTSVGEHGFFLKLADFNISRFLGVPDISNISYQNGEEIIQDLTQRVGSQYYMAPEVERTDTYDHKSDIFSMAIIATEIFNFQDNIITISELAKSNKLDLNKYLEEYLGTNVEQAFKKFLVVLKKCLNLDPNIRPDCQQLLTLCDDFIIDKGLLKEDQVLFNQVKETLQRKEYKFLGELFFYQYGIRFGKSTGADIFSCGSIEWGEFKPI